MMKIRIRNRKITKSIDIDNECKLNDLRQFIFGLFDNTFPRGYFFSLNGRDPMTGADTSTEEDSPWNKDDLTLKDCNIVGGDLIHIVSLDEEKIPTLSNEQDKSVAMETDHSTCSSSKNEDNKPSTSGYYGNISHIANTENPTSAASGLSYSEPDVAMEEKPVDHAIVNKCLSEPLLCRDSVQGAVPPLLVKVYIESDVTSTHEALVIVLHILMLESGYIPVQTSDQSTASGRSDMMNADWKRGSPASYTLKYTHNSCSDTDIFTLVCLKMGKLLIIHGRSPDKEDIPLNITFCDFIQSIDGEINKVYKNLPKLSMIFKDNISLPLLQTYRQNHGFPVLSGIMSLSHEIKLTVFSFLDVPSTVRMMDTCKDFQQICKDRYLWRRHYLKDFGNRQNNDLSQDWYTIYKTEFQLRKQREKDRRRFLSQMTCIVPPVFRPDHDPGFPNPLPSYPPGMIGGDFDLFPQFQGPGGVGGFGGRRSGHNPLQPLQPRFDPLGPGHSFRPGRGGGLRDNRGMFGRIGGPRFF
ncbi:F-box only protein 7-like isoform X1 [Mytilus galloprovincialis]|uniref:F-box only protein 7-like isoform X1 n=1 Tax=Mytilus galloprovincialis TaxID=29158 RepID=UPI003F7C760B